MKHKDKSSMEEKTLPSVEDPIKLIRGILKSEKGKQSSVELQHDKSVWLKKFEN